MPERSPAILPFMLFPQRIVSVLLPQPLPEPFDYLLPDGMEASAGDFVVVPLGPREMIGVVWAVKGGPPARPLKSVLEKIEGAPSLPEATRTFIDRASKYVCTPPGNLLAMTMRSREALEEPPTEKLVMATGDAPERLTPAREKVLAEATAPLAPGDLAKAAGVSSGVVKGLVDAGALTIVERSLDPPYANPDPDRTGKPLTSDQQAAAAALSDFVRERGYRPALLDGITGSGKTEVYFEAIAAALRDDSTAQILVLLPEI